jgi:hypothetical protein
MQTQAYVRASFPHYDLLCFICACFYTLHACCRAIAPIKIKSINQLGLFICSKMYLESTNEGHEHAEVDTEDAKEETNVADANGEEQHGEARALVDAERENSFTHEEDEELNYNEEDEDYEGVTGD